MNKKINKQKSLNELNYNSQNMNYYLFTIEKNSILVFNCLTHKFSKLLPTNIESFLKEYEFEGSSHFNIFEGLFILTSSEFNNLFYFSYRKNEIINLIKFNFNHKFGSLFMTDSNKFLIILGGKNQKKVEKFSIEKKTIENLPDLNYARMQSAINIIDKRKIFIFFGIENNNENNNKNSIEYLNLDEIKNGWKIINLNYKENLSELKGCSGINLGNNEIVILGGNNNGKNTNKMFNINLNNNKISLVNESIPISNNKKNDFYTFNKFSMFKKYVINENVYYINFDDENEVHLVNDELKNNIFIKEEDEEYE